MISYGPWIKILSLIEKTVMQKKKSLQRGIYIGSPTKL